MKPVPIAIGLTITTVVILVVVLCAALIPRPVPCGDYRPNVTKVSTLVPEYNDTGFYNGTEEIPVVCYNPDRAIESLKMRGGFFDLYDMSPGGGVYPTFTFGNYTFPNVTIYRHLCKGINVYRRPNVYVCNQAEMEAPYRDPVGDLAVTAFPFTVQNPEPCSDQFAQRNVTVIWEEKLNLVVTELDPAVICQSSLSGDQPLTIVGQGFLRIEVINGSVYEPTVWFNNQKLSDARVNQGSCTNFTEAPDAITQVCTEIITTFPQILDLSNVVNTLVVENPLPCASSNYTVTSAFIISDSLLVVYYAEPQTILTTVPFQISVLTTGLIEPARSVELYDNVTGNYIDLAFTSDLTGNDILATIPAGTLTGGRIYDVVVTAKTGCSATLPKAITATSATNIEVKTIEPDHVWADADSGVTVTSFPALTGPSGTNVEFQELPNVFLLPTGTGNAVPLKFVSFVDSITLSVKIPKGTVPAGSYDVIIVNPDGDAGRVSSGITVTSVAPPVVTSITRSFLQSGTAASVTIAGKNFVSGLTLTSSCINFPNFDTPLTIQLGITDVTFVSSTEVTATFDPTSLEVGVVCTVRLTNPDGSSYLYSAITIKASSGNLEALAPSPSLVEGRRAHAIAVGTAAPSQSFIYALGGEASVNAGRKDSVERASISAFGQIGSWTLDVQDALPTPLSYHKAEVIGQYIYVVGGKTNTGVRGETSRARILDPLDVATLDIGITLEENITGIAPGRYYYTVSAIYGATDPQNPSGEGLPAPALPVTLPDLSINNYGLVITLGWSTIERAVGYKVYRTVAPGDAMGTMKLIGTVTSNTFEDDGSATPAGASPLPVGSLGQWHTIATLATPRARHSMVKSRDVNDPNKYYLHVIGGRDASDNLIPGYEVLVVDVSSPEHSVASWAAQSFTGVTPTTTSDGGAAVLTPADSVFAGSNNWLFFGGGNSGTSAAFTNIDLIWSAQIGGGGILGNVALSIANLKGGMSGFCMVQAAGSYLAMGVDSTTADELPGTGGNTNRGREAQQTAGPPDIGGSNSFGPSPAAQFLTSRRYLACTVGSGLIFEIGGNDATGNGLSDVFSLVQ